jgi:hypothetical protein
MKRFMVSCGGTKPSQTHRGFETPPLTILFYLVPMWCGQSLNVQFHNRMNLPCSVALKIGSPI